MTALTYKSEIVNEALEILNSANMKLDGVDQDLSSIYQIISTSRGSNYIDIDILNPKEIGHNTQDMIDKMIENIRTSVDSIKKMAEYQESNKASSNIDISKTANDYVIVNSTSSNDPKTSAEYNRGFAMGVKSSFVTAGSAVAASYLIKGAEGLYKKVRNKDKKKEETATIGNQEVVQQQVIQQPTTQQVVQQQVVQVPQMNQQTQIANQQQIINTPVQ